MGINMEKQIVVAENTPKPIVSFACGKTYKLINETHIHAHPVKSRYPSDVYPYLMARAKGGITDYLFKVVDCLELNPKDNELVNSLPTKYASVRDYIKRRMPNLGFDKAPTPYRFYLLEPIHRFIPVFTISDNDERPRYYSFEEVGLKELEHLLIVERNIEDEANESNLLGEDRLAFVKNRVNQSVFRDLLLHKFKKCCLCGMDDENLLIASHIKPWADSTRKERVDVENGLLLCPNHDKLFDKGYISFGDDGKIIISNELSETNQRYMNVSIDMNISMSETTKVYMQYHRDLFRDKL